MKQLLPLSESSDAYPQCPRNCLQSSTRNPCFKTNNNGSIKYLALSEALPFCTKIVVLKLTFIPFFSCLSISSLSAISSFSFFISFYLFVCLSPSLSLTPTDSLLNVAWIHRALYEIKLKTLSSPL